MITETKAELCFDFYEILEDTIEYFTEEYQVSAEELYLLTQTFSERKLDKLVSMKKVLTND